MGEYDSNQTIVASGSSSSSSTSSKSSNIFKDLFTSIVFGYFSYATVKEVKTHNLVVAILFRILQLCVLVYVI